MHKLFHGADFTTTRTLALAGSLIVGCGGMAFSASPPSLEQCQAEPVRYVGSESTDRRWHHGAIPPAVGVHRYQALRANRALAAEGGLVGWTYNHAPMLAYWDSRFWINYVSNLKEEHNDPGRTGVLWSIDGRNWSPPGVVFPKQPLPEIEPPPRYFDGEQLPLVPAGTYSIMHQRMGWYVSPDGRFLACGFYSYCPNPRWGPNRGQGIGRVVREVHRDGTFGPIHYIRYNTEAGWSKDNAPWFPFYAESSDDGFKAACEALLADRLVTLQWWEEDRASDGFFALKLAPDVQPKALSYFQRPDGVTVGLWKGHLAALSPDGGSSWTPVGRHPFPESSAKIWGQRTDDGRYALVYDHSATKRNRFPLVVVTSDDGYSFDHMLAIHGEVPPQRFQGIHKPEGPQYVRGITPGNGDPPGDDLWVTYSMGKEDIWVARVRVPVTGEVKEPVRDDFEGPASGSDLAWWNLYVPQWAPVRVLADPRDGANRCLELRDEEPYDYAKAERIFPAASRVRLQFRVMQQQVGVAKLEVEVQGERGERPLRLRFDEEWLGFDEGPAEPRPAPFDVGRWHAVELRIDCAAQSYEARVDGRLADVVEFAVPVDAVQRLVVRTGPFRMDVRATILDGGPGNRGLTSEDLPGADAKVPASVFLLDDVAIDRLDD